MIGTLALNALAVALLLGGAVAATAGLRRRSAAERHWLLAVAVVAALAVPLLRMALPDRVRMVGLAALTTATEAPRPATSPARPGLPDPVTVTFEASAPTPSPTPQPITLLPWIWLGGAALMAVRLLAGLARLRTIAAGAVPVESGAWRTTCDELCRDLALATPVRLLHSPHPSLLATWGHWRPRIVLPREAMSWPPDRVRVVLAHELAHVARGDWTRQLLGEGLRLLHWFNPLAWRVCRLLRLESERASDDAVLALGVDAPVFADHLVALALQLRPPAPPWLPAPAMVRQSSLEGRVRAMLDPSIVRQPASPSRRGALAGAVLVLAVLLASLGAAAQYHAVRGSLTDQSGRSLPGATVVLTDAAAERKYEVRSDAGGHFEFVALPPGAYRLEVRTPGFKPYSAALDVSGDIERALRLDVGALQETITVIGDGQPAPPPDPAAAQQRAERQRRAGERQEKALATCKAGPPAAVGGNILPPMKIVHVSPAYPEHLRPADVRGTVTMRATIDREGVVREVTDVVASHPDFEAPAVDAVRAWRFTTTLLNCEPIEVEMTVTVNFSTAR